MIMLENQAHLFEVRVKGILLHGNNFDDIRIYSI